MSEPEAIEQRLTTSRERLLATIAGVSEEQFKRRPAPAEEGQRPGWCIAEVLAHLMFSERQASQRIAAALAEDGAAVEAADPEQAEEAARSGRTSPVPQLIHGLLATRRELEKQLATTRERENGLQLGVVHARRGRLSIEALLDAVASHESEHLAQIEALKAAGAAQN